MSVREETREGVRRPWRHRLFWAERSDHARLLRELKSFRVELALLEENAESGHALSEPSERETDHRVASAANADGLDSPWKTAAHSEVENAQRYLDREENIEGGWASLHAARRYAVHGRKRDDLLLQASILKAEAEKIPIQSWRGKEMKHLLDVPDEEVTVRRVITAMALRDEYFSNQYHKIWLVGGQIKILLICCGLGLLLLIPFIVSSSIGLPSTLTPWGYQMVGAVLFFGLFGAAFSAAGSLMNSSTVSKIPERVANQFVTIARALFGAGAGLAGYALYESKAMNFRFGDETGPGSALAVALLFGFAGEMLIAKVLGSLGSTPPETQK